MTRYKSLLGERSQSLAVFEFDENSHLFRILPQTGSFALPYYHNTVARSFPPSVCSNCTIPISFFSRHSLLCLRACARALCPVCVGIALPRFNPRDGLLEPNPPQSPF